MLRFAIPACVAALAWTVPSGAVGQQGPVDGTQVSAHIGNLAARLAAGDGSATDDFWSRVERSGTPLVEPDTAFAGHSIVTFVARGGGGVDRVRLSSNLTALQVEDEYVSPDELGHFERLADSDVWYLSFRLRNDVRVPYQLEIHRAEGGDTTAVDPLNPVIWEPAVAGLRASILELPGAPGQPWRTAAGEEGAGDWDELTPDDEGGRNVYVYKPVPWDAERQRRYPLLIGLGAFGHGIGMRVDRMVDALIEAGRLPPVLVALVDLTGEDEGTRYASTAAFLLDELLPYLRERYGATTDAAEVVVSGTSRRGMVASLLALEHPEVFGNVLSLSGSYYWRPAGEGEFEWVPRRYAEAPARDVAFYVAAGELETFVSPGNRGHYLLATNRHMRDVLRARGYRLRYEEFNGVHSELSWQDGLAEGLVHLLGRRDR